jgi:enoyl-CoA hydratase
VALNAYEFIRWDLDGPVATVWMSRPPVNAVNQAMYKEIHRLFTNIDQVGADVRTVILASDVRHFCGGNDLDEFRTLDPDNSRERMFNAREAFWAIYSCDVPVIAAVHGAALGTGLAIAASCDMIVASDDARLGLPEIKVGVMGGARHLSRLMPQAVVRRMFYSGEPLPGADFVPHGGVLKVVPRDDLMAEARQIADEFVRHSPVALRYAKKSLNEIEFMNLKHGYEFEQSLTGELSGHEDSKEAVNAFLERREPRYAAPRGS